MNWQEQSSELMKTWAEAQKQMFSGWMGLLQGGNAPAFGMPSFDPSAMLKSAVDTWSGLQGNTAQRFAGNVFGTPEIMAHSVNLIMKAWKVAAPKIEAGQPWAPDVQSLIKSWQEEMTALPGRQSATLNEFSELTKSVFEKWTPATGPWLSMVGQAISSGHPGQAFLGGTQGFGQIMQFGEGMLPAVGGVSQLPRGTVVRQKMGKILEAVDAMSELQKTQADFNKSMSEAMGTAVERTVEHLAKLSEEGKPITSVRDLMRTWYGTADRTLNEAFTSDEFLAKQDAMTEALLTFKVKKRDAMELFYESMDIPTRSNMDEAYRDIQDLKREVRALRKALKETQGSATPKRATAAAKKTAAAS